VLTERQLAEDGTADQIVIAIEADGSLAR